MTNKAYIVANEQQERDVLGKLEREGCVWHSNSTKPTEYIPSKHFIIGEQFPTAIVKIFNNRIMYETNYEDGNIKQDEEIIYDGRKEEQMIEKYVVSQEFMDKLEDWKGTLESNDDEYEHFVGIDKLTVLPDVVFDWRYIDNVKERNNRLIAILRWVNGEGMFEVKKPKKLVVRSKEHDEGGHYQYVKAGNFDMSFNEYHIEHATRFDTKEEAQSWANSHQEVMEVEE